MINQEEKWMDYEEYLYHNRWMAAHRAEQWRKFNKLYQQTIEEIEQELAGTLYVPKVERTDRLLEYKEIPTERLYEHDTLLRFGKDGGGWWYIPKNEGANLRKMEEDFRKIERNFMYSAFDTTKIKERIIELQEKKLDKPGIGGTPFLIQFEHDWWNKERQEQARKDFSYSTDITPKPDFTTLSGSTLKYVIGIDPYKDESVSLPLQVQKHKDSLNKRIMSEENIQNNGTGAALLIVSVVLIILIWIFKLS